MYIYNALSHPSFLKKKFSSKFLFIAFLGIHIPLIGLVVYMMIDVHHPVSMLRVSAVVLALTLASTIATLYILDKLLHPLRKAKVSLATYLASGNMPNLPTHYEDEVGELLSHIQMTIEKLDQLLSEKSDMIDMLSHDVRSPISRIIALSNLIDMDKDTDPSEYTAHIVEESKGLLTLLEDVLSMLRKAEGNEITFHLTPTSLKSIVTKSVSFYEHAAQQKNIKYHINIEEGLMVNLEQVMFAQVIKNLLSNALKFSGNGKNIFITSIAESKKLLLTIKDEGMGFDPQNKEKIFDRFTRASKKGLQGESSTGLGLSLARKIIEKHGGQLVANSEGQGKGATFTVILPRTNARTHAKGFRIVKVTNPFKKAI